MGTFLTFVGLIAIMAMTALVVFALAVRHALLQARVTARRVMTEAQTGSPYVRANPTDAPWASRTAPQTRVRTDRAGHTIIEGEVIR